uniref:Serum response factor-binding protein 1 n=1 Tax=Setaria digitata TaxID=48799 RepID=A0A915Q5Q8_9BILA
MSSLTPMKLNEQIISMRKAVEKARVRLCRRLIRQRKLIQKSKDEKKTRKMDRIIREIDRCKKMSRDEVSKFALVNLKALTDLLVKRSEISVDERILYKLACQEIVLKNVEEFRAKYPNWQREVPFLLQRLGLQYKSKREAKKIESEQSKTVKAAEMCTRIETENDVKALVTKQIRKTVKKEESLERKKKKLEDKKKSNKSDEICAPVLNLPKLELPKPVIAKGQAVIKLLSLDSSQSEECSSLKVTKENVAFERNTEANVICEEDDPTSTNPPVKANYGQKRKKDFEESKRRNDAKGQLESRTKLSLKDCKVMSSTAKLLENQDLHPSWIAKRREHEALMEMQASCKPKKIVFDDD